MKTTWIGQSCFRVEFGGSRILIDPFLTGNPSLEKAGICEIDVIDGMTLGALSREHEDHVGDTVQFARRPE